MKMYMAYARRDGCLNECRYFARFAEAKRYEKDLRTLYQNKNESTGIELFDVPRNAEDLAEWLNVQLLDS